MENEDKKKASPTLIEKAKKAAAGMLDINGDGELSREDVSELASAIGSSAKKAASAVRVGARETGRQFGEKLDSAKRTMELARLRPIFPEDLADNDFLMPKLVCVADMDKKHAESELCQGSIGFRSDEKELPVVHIFRDKAIFFGLSFFPDADSGVYYVDPSDRDRYIALDEYFSYLKTARVNELQRIAKDLGAKHFRVTYKEQKKSFSSQSIAASVKASKIGTADAKQDTSAASFTSVEIAAEMDCEGHAPVEPKLVYLKMEPSIQTLIELRMSDNQMRHQKYTLQLSNSSGIKARDAVKIDAALNAMKISGNATVSSEVQSEARRFFEYEIDF